MLHSLRHVVSLGLGELRCFVRDPALLLFTAYAFTVYVATAGGGLSLDVHQATVAVVDEDHSPLSQRIVQAIRPPEFRRPVALDPRGVKGALDRGEFTFVLHLPPDLERSLASGREVHAQLDVDATAVSQAALGASYLEAIVARAAGGRDTSERPTVRIRFNPASQGSWHVSVVEMMFVVTLMSILLPAASLLRERDRGAMEYRLAMPLRPLELMLAKAWPYAVVVTLGALLSLELIVHGLFGAPARGSWVAFAAGTLLFQLTTSGLGILLATAARNVAHVALLAMLLVVPMLLLSGAWTPIESLPMALRPLTLLSPLRYYAEFVFGVVLRGAPATLLPGPLLALAGLGIAFFTAGAMRFRARFAAG